MRSSAFCSFATQTRSLRDGLEISVKCHVQGRILAHSVQKTGLVSVRFGWDEVRSRVARSALLDTQRISAIVEFVVPRSIPSTAMTLHWWKRRLPTDRAD